jgi:tripartite-type tricarboxylate transporter receptor subunit TctC
VALAGHFAKSPATLPRLTVAVPHKIIPASEWRRRAGSGAEIAMTSVGCGLGLLRSLLVASGIMVAANAVAQSLPQTSRQAASQAWPQRTVKLIVPFAAGSAADTTARLFADRLAERWGRAVVVEDRPGPDGLVAITGFVSARDDHALFFANGGPVTINPVVHDKLPYDPLRDLVPIVSASDSYLTVAANAALRIDSIDALVELAKTQPGRLTWAATPGLPQFTFAGFLKRAGLDMTQIAYRDFTPALQDVAEGRVALAVTALLPLLPLAQAGKVKLLVVTNRARSPAAQDLRTADEIGHPELAADGFQGFFGWRDIPDDLRARIAADVNAVAADATLATRLAAVGQALRVGTTADFVAMIDAQRTKIAAIARALALTPQ